MGPPGGPVQVQCQKRTEVDKRSMDSPKMVLISQWHYEPPRSQDLTATFGSSEASRQRQGSAAVQADASESAGASMTMPSGALTSFGAFSPIVKLEGSSLLCGDEESLVL